VTDIHQQSEIAARYLVSYDWPVTANPQEILLRLQRIVTELGNTTLPVMAIGHGKKRPRTTDLFKIKDFSAIQSVETTEDWAPTGALGKLSYSDNKNLNMAELCIAIRYRHMQPNTVIDTIRSLHEVDAIGYTIAFDAPLGMKSLYFAMGITFGEVKTHYEEMCADKLGRFFFQRTRKNRSDRAYNHDKLRDIYPMSVLNPQQKRALCEETGIDTDRFEALDDDRHLLVLDGKEVLELREKLVGSALLI
jgi:hypothetical protein